MWAMRSTLSDFLAVRQPHGFELGQALEAVANGAVIGEGAAEPAFVDVRHLAADGLAFDGFLGLALGADEDDEAAAAGDLGEEFVCSQEAAHGFAQIDDVNEIALAVDVRPHLGIPATGAVTEVHAGFNELLNLNDRHARPPGSKHLPPQVSGRKYRKRYCRIHFSGREGEESGINGQESEINGHANRDIQSGAESNPRRIYRRAGALDAGRAPSGR